MTFPISLSVNPNGETPEARVFVKFPWYSFFLQKYVSKSVLVRDISAALEKIDRGGDALDVRTQLLTAVTQVISQRVDTVEDSLR